MDKMLLNQKVLKKEEAIWVFTIMSLVFGAIASLSYFITFHWSSDQTSIIWRFSSNLFIGFILYVSAYILLALFIFKFSRKNWGCIILASAISAIAFLSMNDLLYDIAIISSYQDLISLFFSFSMFSLAVLLIISLLIGLNNKVIITIFSIINFTRSSYALIIAFRYVSWFGGMFVGMRIIYFIANITFYVALLILGTSNKILSLRNKNRV